MSKTMTVNYPTGLLIIFLSVVLITMVSALTAISLVSDSGESTRASIQQPAEAVVAMTAVSTERP